VYDLQWHRLQRFLSKPSTITAIVVLFGSGVVAYQYGLPKYRQFIETRYAAQARLFLSKGDLARASLRARQALLMNQDNVVATLVAADLAERGRSPQAVYWRQRAVALAPTTMNRLALAATALKTEEFPFEITTRTLRSLPPTERGTFEFSVTAAALAAKMGDLAEAERLYAHAVNLNPTNPAAKMSLAVLRLQSKNPEAAQDSRTTLGLLSAEGRIGVLPLRALVAEAFQRKDYQTAEQLSTRLLTNSQASFSDGILHAALLRAEGSTDFNTFLTDLQERALRHPASVGELAAWMNQVGMARQAREWLETVLEKAPGQTMLRLAVADSYVALGEWSALQQWLEKERWGGMDHMRFAMLSLAIRNQGPNTRYKVAWDRAVALAGHAPTALNTLAKVTASWGWQDETEQVLWQAANRFKTAKWPLDKLKAIYTLRKESAGLRRVFQAMMQRDRTDKVAQNNFASLSLLLNKDTSQACTIAKELYDAEPENGLFVSTYAFALHFQGRSAEGLTVIEKLKDDALNAPAIAAYHGILLAAAGRNDEAKAALAKAEKAFLLPEEKTLVNAALKRIQ
jgi:tetratricopeptide (TPR) repeat protein